MDKLVNSTKSSEKNPPDNENFFRTLEITMQYYDKLLGKAIEENKCMEKETTRRILRDFHSLTHHIITKINLGFYYGIVDKIYFIEDKFKIHQFTHKYLDVLDFAKEMKGDGTLEEVLNRDNMKISLNQDNLEEYFSQRLEMFSKSYFPAEWNTLNEDFTNQQEISARKNLYLQDYCFKLEQSYETFVVMATFTLVLCRYILNKPVDDLILALEDKKKLSTLKLYFDPLSHSDNKPLLKECFSKLLPPEADISLFFEEIFKPNGIRDIRNRIIHHLFEKDKCEASENGLKITFDDGIVKDLSINDLNLLYGKLFSMTVLFYLHSIRQKLNALYVLGKDIELRESEKK
ncbi:hypothetical protein ES708_16727 [subsurface metagenome]